MPEIKITVGGREFEVACQSGEEQFLRQAAKMLDTEASALVSQIGRIPENRMLLMAGLMLADKTAGFEEQLRAAEAGAAALAQEVEELRNAPPPEPQRVEVPVVPQSMIETMAEIAARTEALADRTEEKAAG